MFAALNSSIKFTTQIVSDEERKIISTINLAIICSIFSLFGAVANVINLIVFHRQGLDTTINISFFSLTVSDLCSLVLQLVYNIFVNPLFVNLALPIVHTEVQFLTTACPRAMFAQITCMITAFITVERCVCVVFPLRVKQIFTPTATTVVIVAIYTSTFLMASPLLFTSYYTWRFYPDWNTTLLSLAFTSYHVEAEAASCIAHAITTVVGFMTVLSFTVILIYNLRLKNKWRKTANTDNDKTRMLTKRDKEAITMVVLIAGILIACYTPAILTAVATSMVPEFSITGSYYNLYCVIWSFALDLQVVNSSVNIFLYYQMSSKYRRTCGQLFFASLRLDVLDITNKDS